MFVDLASEAVGHGAVVSQLLLDGSELVVGGVAGGEEVPVGAPGIGADLAESAGLGNPLVEAAEFVPESPCLLLPPFDDAREPGVQGPSDQAALQ